MTEAVAPDWTHLAGVGMPEPAARAYAFLVRHGPATAREVAQAAGLHRSRAYGVLETVEKLGLAEALVGEPRRFVALPLAPFLEREIARADAEAREAEAAARRVHDLFPDPAMLPEGAFGDLRVTTGRRRTGALLARAILEARERTWWLTTPAGVVRLANHAEGADAVDALATRRRDVRVVLLPAREDDPVNHALAEEARALLSAAVTRVAPGDFAGLAHRLVVDDARLLLVHPDPDDMRAYRGSDTCLDTTIPALVKDASDVVGRAWHAGAAVRHV